MADPVPATLREETSAKLYAEWKRLPEDCPSYFPWLEAELTAARLAQQEAERQLLTDDGQWICRTCGFQLTKAILRASDGAVGVDRAEVEDICPNDGSSLRRLTWKEDAENANRVGLDFMKRLDAAESRLTEAHLEIEQLKGALAAKA